METIVDDPTDFRSFGKIARLNRDIVITEKIDGTNAQVLILPIKLGDTPKTPPLASVKLLPGDPGAWLFPEVEATHHVWAGSRARWVTPEKDNYGWAAFVKKNALALAEALGVGRHFGEWWGPGIQRRYNVSGRYFSLFNVGKWGKVEAYLDPRCEEKVDVRCKMNVLADGVGHAVNCTCRPVTHQVDRSGVVRCACREGRSPISLGLDGGVVMPVPTLYQGPWFNSGGWAPWVALNDLRARGSVASPGFDRPEGIVVFHEASGQLYKATLENDEKPKGLA